MYLGMAFEIVLSNEAFLACWTLELPIVKMGLDMRLDVLLAAKFLVAVLKGTYPLIVSWIRTLDVLLNVVECDACGRLCLLNVYACNACSTGLAGD
jgi:hypothetical protein